MTKVSNGIYGKLTVIRANGDDANFFPLNELETSLGRDPACQVQLRSLDISRTHAKIVFDADTREATLIDCSTNGLILNSELVTEPTILKNDDVIELGQRNFRFEKSDPISASKMTSIQQKLKSSPGFFKKKAETMADLPPTPIKKRSAQIPMQKMLFKDLISAKYADKDLETESEMEAGQRSNVTANSTPQKGMESPKELDTTFAPLIESTRKTPSYASPQKNMESPTGRKMGLAQRVKVTPSSAPRLMGDKLAVFKKSLSVANSPKGQINFLKQMKDAKKIVKTSPKITMTTPKSAQNGQKGSYIPKSSLSSRQLSTKKSISACQSVAKAAQSSAKQPSILNASKDVFFQQVQDFVGIKKIAYTAEKSDGKISPESESNRRRSVTFGPPLEPEIFDKRNAPSSPLTRGEPAPQVGSKDGTPIHKSILKMGNEERGSTGSKKADRVSTALPAKVNCSSPLSKDAGMLPMSAPPSAKSNKSSKALEADVSLVDGDIHDGLTSSSVEGIASSEAELVEEPLSLQEAVELVSEGISTSRVGQVKENVKAQDEVECGYSGLKGLLKTPKSFYQKDAELSGLSILFDSPKVNNTPACVDVVTEPPCTKENTSQEKSEISYAGVKNLLKTPKPDMNVSYLGLKETLKTPIHHSISSVNLVGVKELLNTPKDGSVPSLVGIKEILKTPKPSHTLNFEGVKEMLETPGAFKSESMESLAEVNEPVKEAKEQIAMPSRVTRSLRSRAVVVDESVVEKEKSVKSVEEKENLKSIPANTFYSKPVKPKPEIKIQSAPKESKIPTKKSRKRVLEEKSETVNVKKPVMETVSKPLRRSSRLQH